MLPQASLSADEQVCATEILMETGRKCTRSAAQLHYPTTNVSPSSLAPQVFDRTTTVWVGVSLGDLLPEGALDACAVRHMHLECPLRDTNSLQLTGPGLLRYDLTHTISV